MISQIFNTETFKILTIFSISPGSKMQRKELKEKTRMNNIILDNALNSLINSDILKKEKRLFNVNLGNEKVKSIIDIVSKQYKELKELPLKVYFALIELTDLLSRFKFLSAHLFGSYAKLVFKEDSDIDIAIVSNNEDKIRKSVDNLVQKLESRYSINMEIHYFGSNFYKNKHDPLVKEIIQNGVKLV